MRFNELVNPDGGVLKMLDGLVGCPAFDDKFRREVKGQLAGVGSARLRGTCIRPPHRIRQGATGEGAGLQRVSAFLIAPGRLASAEGGRLHVDLSKLQAFRTVTLVANSLNGRALREAFFDDVGGDPREVVDKVFGSCEQVSEQEITLRNLLRFGPVMMSYDISTTYLKSAGQTVFKEEDPLQTPHLTVSGRPARHAAMIHGRAAPGCGSLACAGGGAGAASASAPAVGGARWASFGEAGTAAAGTGAGTEACVRGRELVGPEVFRAHARVQAQFLPGFAGDLRVARRGSRGCAGRVAVGVRHGNLQRGGDRPVKRWRE
jgi:hypothetical protein